MGSTESPTYYFAFGSNLWRDQMRLRCPGSTYVGIGRLNSFKFIINTRGYANVVSSLSSTPPPPPRSSSTTSHVYGLIYTLTPPDETRLDRNEGVPHCYTKEYHTIDFWMDGWDVTQPPESLKNVLVYIDRLRITEDKPKEEYVYRMNKGVEDAVRCGVPESYVEGVVRKFIPVVGEEGGKVDDEVKNVARRQAVEFVDGL